MERQDPFAQQRRRMVEEQLKARGIRDQRVLDAMLNVPRHLFVRPEDREWAYADGPLPIGFGQTISQPYIVARMTELLGLKGEEKVLEIGTGSGYQAAVLAHLAREVHTVERIPELAEQARERLKRLGLTNVHVHVADGTLGWPAEAPYDAILVTAAAPQIPQPLLEQLAEGGRLVAPVGSRGLQYLERWTQVGDDFLHERFEPVAFVPLVGKYGWHPGDYGNAEPSTGR